MSSRTCPDWPDLMELAPELQFKHYTVAEVQLPADALMKITSASSGFAVSPCVRVNVGATNGFGTTGIFNLWPSDKARVRLGNAFTRASNPSSINPSRR